MKRLRFCLGAAAVAFLPALAPTPALAHPVQFTTLQVRVEPDGKFQAVLNIDILAFALHKTSQASTNEELQALLDGPRPALARDLADAGPRFQREVVVHTDAGAAQVLSWTLPSLPEVNAVLALNLHPNILMPGEIRFSGTLPIKAKSLAIRLPYVLGDTVHVYELPGGDTSEEPVIAGAYATPVVISLQPSNRLRMMARQGSAGFRSMFSFPPEHLFFVIAFFLLSPRLAPLLGQACAFTAGHSLALWLATCRLVQLPPHLLGPLTAASVLVVALENVFTGELKPWRLVVVFGFGLLHGISFAHAFIRKTLPRDENFPALAGFHLGLELGLLAILLAAFATIGWFRHRAWYRERMAVPASGLIALVALLWIFQRIFWPAQA